MSGGSFNYLCHRSFEEITARQEDLQQMADELAKLGYAEDATRETMETLLEIRQAQIRIDTRLKRLNNVWYAVEWWRSCDVSEDAVKEALSSYRKETKKGTA